VWVPFAGQVIAGPYHQVLGEGCVYPAAVQTLGNQLSAAGRSWAAYLQDMGNDPARDNTVSTARGPACGHPATWAIDHTQKAAKGDQYAARHDGFTFFRSVTGNQAYCDAHILSFRPLPGDLTRVGTTPALSWISPNLCDDGHDAPCVTGAPGGLAQADASLAQWVPKIMAAPARSAGPGARRTAARPFRLVRGEARSVVVCSSAGIALCPGGVPVAPLCSIMISSLSSSADAEYDRFCN
jgi:hypothetical protein